MKRIAMIALAACAAASAARAQDAGAVGSLAAAAQGVGQALGEAAAGRSSVVVTAVGRAPLAGGPVADVYTAPVEGRAASAVEAARQHDDRLKAAQALAARFGVALEAGRTVFAQEPDPTQRRMVQPAAPPGAPALMVPPPNAPGAPRLYVVRTVLRLRPSSPDRFAAFLDALKAEGVDSLTAGPAGRPGGFNPAELLGLGPAQRTDNDPAWDRAAQDAVAAARRQAQVLAAASGRTLGQVTQVLLIGRSLQGDQASVTVSVRYALD